MKFNNWGFKIIFFLALISIGSAVYSARLHYKYSNIYDKLKKVDEILHLQKAIMRPADLDSSKAAIKIDSLYRLLEVQAIKEEYYIDQLGVLSDWLILFVTGLFTVLTLFGFFNFNRVVAQVSEQEKKNNEQFAQNELRFKEMESANHKMLGNIQAGLGDVYLKAEKFSDAFYQYVFAVFNYSEGIDITGHTEPSKIFIMKRIDDAIRSLQLTTKLNSDLSPEDLNRVKSICLESIKRIKNHEMEMKLLYIIKGIENLKS